MEIQSSSAWLAYLELRKKKSARAPFTEIARGRILERLKKLGSEGQNIEAVLYQSVECGWTGVFAVPDAVKSKTVPSDEYDKSMAYLAERSKRVLTDAQRLEVSQRLKETRTRLLEKKLSTASFSTLSTGSGS